MSVPELEFLSVKEVKSTNKNFLLSKNFAPAKFFTVQLKLACLYLSGTLFIKCKFWFKTKFLLLPRPSWNL